MALQPDPLLHRATPAIGGFGHEGVIDPLGRVPVGAKEVSSHGSSRWDGLIDVGGELLEDVILKEALGTQNPEPDRLFIGGMKMSESWLVKQNGNDVQTSVSNLKGMVELGTLLPESYVYNPILEKWLYARDTAELGPLFASADRAKSAKGINSAGLIFGILGLLALPFVPTFGLLFIGIGIVLSIVYYAKR